MASAAEALALLDEDPTMFDLVFSDVVMAGMNGLELANHIREKFAHLPVVLTSGYSDLVTDKGYLRLQVDA